MKTSFFDYKNFCPRFKEKHVLNSCKKKTFNENLNMSVSIRRRVTRNQGFTVIIFDKDHIYNWPTNIHEHNEILKLYKQDRTYEGIYNDHSELISHLQNSD